MKHASRPPAAGPRPPGPGRVALLYSLFAALWILASGYLVSATLQEPTLVKWAETAKGLVFVAVTGGLLYLLLRAWREPDCTQAGDSAFPSAGPGARGFWLLLLCFLGLVPLAGVAVVKLHSPGQEREALASLEAVAALQTRQIQEWLAAQNTDGEIFAANDGFISRIAAMRNDGDPRHASFVRGRLESYVRANRYGAVLLLDPRGDPLLTLGSHSAPPALTRLLAANALRSRAVQSSGLFRDESGTLHLDLVVPLFSTESGAPVAVAVLVLHADPAERLLPFIESWPTASPSGESLLLRREGDTAISLNPPRHGARGGMTLRLSLADAAFPIRDIFRDGAAGTLRGIDYRGEPVLAAYRPVAGSDWVLLSKLDRDEVLAETRRLGWWVGVITFFAAAAISAALLLLWRQQRRNHSLALAAEGARARLESEQRYRAVAESAVDAIVTIDQASRVVGWNPAAEHMFGYTEAEISGAPVTLLMPEPARDEHPRFVARLLEGGEPRVLGRTTELRAVGKDGREFPVEVALGRWENQEGRFFTGIIRDIRERKQAEAALRRQKDLYDLLSQTNQATVRVGDRDELLQRVCRVAVEHGHFRFAWVGLADAAPATLRVAARHGGGQQADAWLRSCAEEPARRNLHDRVLETGTRALSNDVLADADLASWHEAARHCGIRSAGAFPVRHRGAVVGSLNLYAGEPGFFAADVLPTLDEMAVDLSFALDNITRTEDLRTATRVVEASPAVLFRWLPAPDWPIEYVSENVARWGYTAAELRAGRLPYAGIIHPEDLPRVSLDFERFLAAGGSEFVGEYRIRTAAGTCLWVEERTKVARDTEGSVVHYEGIVTDIDARKRAEQADRSRRELLERLMETSPVAITVLDREGVIGFANREAERVLALDREALADRRYNDPAWWIRDDAGHPVADAALPFRQVMDKGEAVTGATLHIEAPEGQRKILTVNAAPLRDESGNLTGVVAAFVDVTEQRSLEKQFLQAQKMESVGLLAGGIAHDFNNLLSVINGYSDLALRALADDNPLRGKLQEIHRAGVRAADLTRQLLAFSRKQILQPKILDLNAVVSGMEKMLRRILGEDIVLAFSPAPDLWLVKADPGQMEQVIMNLAVNARDAMPEGGRLTVDLQNIELDATYARRRGPVIPGPYVMLAVSDNGIGMDQATLERIFEPFFTTKDVGRGTGLGLPTAYGIVKQSGGYIWVYSEPGHGTTVRIYLPRALAEPAESAPETPVAELRGTETILVVEDEESVRALVEAVLAGAGFRVLAAADGDQALALAAQLHAPPDLLLTDVVLPGLGGRQLAETLRKMQPAPGILYMSGYTNNAIVHHGVLDRDTHFIGKPFTAAELIRKVRAVLDGRHGQP